jgi:hypothetical protein
MVMVVTLFAFFANAIADSAGLTVWLPTSVYGCTLMVEMGVWLAAVCGVWAMRDFPLPP